MVFVAVIGGVYLFFQNNVFEFFKTGTEEIEKIEESVEEENLGEEIDEDVSEEAYKDSICYGCKGFLSNSFICRKNSCLNIDSENEEPCVWVKNPGLALNFCAEEADAIGKGWRYVK